MRGPSGKDVAVEVDEKAASAAAAAASAVVLGLPGAGRVRNVLMLFPGQELAKGWVLTHVMMAIDDILPSGLTSWGKAPVHEDWGPEDVNLMANGNTTITLPAAGGGGYNQTAASISAAWRARAFHVLENVVPHRAKRKKSFGPVNWFSVIS